MEDIKHQILYDIERNVDVFKKVNNVQYRIRCPVCGDSQKNLQDAHCYIKCSDDPAEPMLYNCFKCNAHGRVDQVFLSKLGIHSDAASKLTTQKYSRIGTIKKMNIDIITGSPIPGSPQIRYIEHRIGNGLTLDDYDRFKIIWDMNEIRKHISDKRILNTLPNMNDSISFISDDRTCIMSRSLSDDAETRWRKIKIMNSDARSFYTIKASFDLFTKDVITVNIAEGIIDILSVYKNFNDGANSVYIASLGSDYISAVDNIIMRGMIGPNVIIKIYVDSDVSIRTIKYQLRKYKWLFNKIIILQNIKSKDVGVPIDQIKLVEINI